MTGPSDRRIALITGSTGGIGEMTALQLALQGLHVILHGRSETSCQAAIQHIRQIFPAASLDFLDADLAALDNVRALARLFKERYNRLDILVNNAGGFFLRHLVSQDNVEMTMAVNHLAHFALTLELIPSLINSSSARIINISSNAHRWAHLKLTELQTPRAYFCISAYGNSKLANLLFTKELARRLEGTTITANALHPGFIATRIGMNNGWFISGVLNFLHKSKLIKLKTIDEGAYTTIYLATSPDVSNTSGEYFIDCKPARSSQVSYNKKLAGDLWKWSADLSMIDLP